MLGRKVEQLNKREMYELVHDLISKKFKNSEHSYLDIVQKYNLDCSVEVLRKIAFGVEFAHVAGMTFREDYMPSLDKDFTERQKLYDIHRNIRKDMREFSRSELICEQIRIAIEALPEIDAKVNVEPIVDRGNAKRDLVLAMGDMHYGAKFQVKGLYDEAINEYNIDVFEYRMNVLSSEVAGIVKKEKPEQLTVMVAGDMLDGMLRASQLQRLEYGIVSSAINLSEFLVKWLTALEENIQIPIRFYAVRGNHGEIRPLGSKAAQFPEENMERVVMHYLYARVQDQKWITVETNDAPLVQMIDVCGYQFLLTHGQNMDISSMAKDYVNLYKKPIDVFVVGHLHKNQTFNGGIAPNSNIYVERVPSICGIDPYAQSRGYGSYAGATAILVDEDHVRKCIYPIEFK